MFPFPLHPTTRSSTPPPRPSTPQTSHTPPPPTAPILASLYSTLLRPTLLPPPATFTQPLLDSFVEHHDPLLEDESLFTVAGRLREVGVEVDKISRDWSRREEVVPVATSEQGENNGWDTMLADIRKAKLRCRLQNQSGGSRNQRAQIKASARERIEEFEKEMQREEEEALKEFKEGLRRAVGGST